VKLADYMICDTLHNLLLDSEEDLLRVVQKQPLPLVLEKTAEEEVS
jgi:hypothetical protein